MMTPEQQRIAIAEWMGFTKIENRNGWLFGRAKPNECMVELPNYPLDLNDMQSAVLAQDKTFIREFDESLEEMAIERGCCICELLASDWATIFLQCKHG